MHVWPGKISLFRYQYGILLIYPGDHSVNKVNDLNKVS
jgi:hypothetical protein